jgi:hypothetical protein
MNHQAIYKTHPTVVRVDDSTGAFDANENPVVIDQSLVDAEASRLQTEQANAVAQKAADKTSAVEKLTALGLSESEVNALIGGV